MLRIASLIFALSLFVAGCLPWSAIVPAQAGDTTGVAQSTQPAPQSSPAPDRAWWANDDKVDRISTPTYSGVKRTSRYVTICNAGILRDKSFLKMSLEDFELVLRVHLLGTVYVTKAAFPVMKDNGYGRIVVTTSASGLYGNFGQTNYAAAKLGIVGFMNSLKLEGLKYNIRVNAVAPLAATRLAQGVFPEEMASRLKPELVTPVVAYLCSEQCEASGDIISAGAGSYSAVKIVESKGVRFGTEQEITPEMIAAKYREITDVEGASSFTDAQEQFATMLTGYRSIID